MSGDNSEGYNYAVKQIEALRQIYSDYLEAFAEKRMGLLSVFASWTSNSPSVTASLSEEFMRKAETAFSQLGDILGKLDEKERNSLSAEAVRLALWPKPVVKGKHRTESELFLKAAEYYSGSLLPFLSLEELTRIRGEYVKATPKRMMFPKERELLKKMEDILNT